MVVNFTIEYKTVWGESLVLLLGGRKLPMRGNGNGLWTVKVSGVKPAQLEGYGYRVLRADGSSRREWKHHSLHIAGASASASLTVRDRWLDQPVDAPFYASAFTEGI
ncbi:MAG: 4-alpha-glucanotransferase, partial [Candidatus Cryptobacteroides sp.]